MLIYIATFNSLAGWACCNKATISQAATDRNASIGAGVSVRNNNHAKRYGCCYAYVSLRPVNKSLVKLGINTFDEGAIELILRNAQGNLRFCRNLCYGSLVESCRENKMTVTLRHVNNMLLQTHWRSHEQLIQQQVR